MTRAFKAPLRFHLAVLVVALVVAGPAQAPAQLETLLSGGADLAALANAITEMEVGRAQELAERYRHAALSVEQSRQLSLERARLALYVGDCDTAEAIVSTLPAEEEGVSSLGDVARRCAGAVAAGQIIEDAEHGVWVRLQDADDAALVPYIAQVAARAMDAVAVDLGVRLPRPLRIDVVRDLFSLSAVSGLPLSAAETTGTVAVARWGRVTLLSPRAARHGYPWEDTMAHEIVHLALSRATLDFAPLWLQEGVAKREELRWREARPFDDPSAHDEVAREALRSGNSVGVANLGPSIAMLPSADAASIAFAEVTSFISFWIGRNGTAAFKLLLTDLRGLADRDPNGALRSVSGYDLAGWVALWQAHLREGQPAADKPAAEGPPIDLRQASKSSRLGDLLLDSQHFGPAAAHFDRSWRAAPRVASLRFRGGLGELARGGSPSSVAAALGSQQDVDSAHAGWLALQGRLAQQAGDAKAASEASTMALGLDPWSETVACEGYPEMLQGASPRRSEQPTDPVRARLCLAARALPPVR